MITVLTWTCPGCSHNAKKNVKTKFATLAPVWCTECATHVPVKVTTKETE